MPTVDQLRSRLIDKLKELFQLNQPDLDFGFYRIMHAKSEQVTGFLETNLPEIIKAALGDTDETRRRELFAAWNNERQMAITYGAPDPDALLKVKEAKARYDAAADTATLEAQIYDHLYRFFERYYEDGDFVSRRYFVRESATRSAPYAVPYSGEEVKLVWANMDQYYIKTAEYFTNFTVDLTKTHTLGASNGSNRGQIEMFAEGAYRGQADNTPDTPLRMHFVIVEASEGEHGNVKASEATKRFFQVHRPDPVGFDERGELVCRFTYRPDPEKTGQDAGWREKRNTEAVQVILDVLQSMSSVDPRANRYRVALERPAPTEKDPKRPLLAKYINQYTARNSMDYFIHKDLGGFLRRELDFYIKNEVMRLDDIEHAEAPRAEQYLVQIRVLRSIAGKLIAFLAQLEEFQKRLWLKKKFVINAHYCITVDKILDIQETSERGILLDLIRTNDAQREEWVRLFKIGMIEEDTADSKPAYSVPLTVEFLYANRYLTVDTALYPDTFKALLLTLIDGLDNASNGLLVKSENLQALALLKNRYRNCIQSIYIDPPYNTDNDGFLYKDSYKNSTWATCLYDRLTAIRSLLRDTGVIFVSINEIERSVLDWVLRSCFGETNRVEELIWIQDTVRNNSPTYSTNHEYIEVYANDRVLVEKQRNMFREEKPGYGEIMALIEEMGVDYPPISFVEAAIATLMKQHRTEYENEARQNGEDIDEARKEDPWKGIYNYKRAEYRDSAGAFVEEANASTSHARLWVWREVDPSMPAGKQSPTIKDPRSSNYRYYRPAHPITGKPCVHPKRGWAFPQFAEGDRPSFEKYLRDNRIVFRPTEAQPPQIKYFLHEVADIVSKSVIRQYSDGEKHLDALFGEKGMFDNPKPPALIQKLVAQTSTSQDIVLDFFAGSGTTAQAVIEQNQKDGGGRKFVLCDASEAFDGVLVPRLKKLAYSKNWESGTPTSRTNGVTQFFKYLCLESYEDCLNNLEFHDTASRRAIMDTNPALQEEHLLHYMLEVEAAKSPSLLNIDMFNDPTSYSLKVKLPGSDVYSYRPVDLLETFNYLLGLRVQQIAAPQTFAASFVRPPDPELPSDQHTRLQIVPGSFKPNSAGPWWLRTVEGWLPQDPDQPQTAEADPAKRRRILIVWRKLTGDLEQDNLVLDEWFRKHHINPRDREYDTIYVNGSNNLPNLRQPGDTWKVRLIEEDFLRLMWDTEGS